MNTTLINLAIYKFYSNKPFYAFSLTHSHSYFSLEQSQFRYFCKSILYSTFPKKIQIENCEFFSFLDSSIKIDSSLHSYIDHYYIAHSFVESSKDLIQIERVIFKESNAERGGCLRIESSSVSIKDSIFVNNSAHIGGAVYILCGRYLNFSQILFFNNHANYDGSIACDSDLEKNFTYIDNLNITNNFAQKWTGGLRIDRSGGFLNRSCFINNSAIVCGGLFYFSWYPQHLDVYFCLFGNNTSKARGGAVTCFHGLQSISFISSLFIFNNCENSFNSISIEENMRDIKVMNCYFSGNIEEEVGSSFSKTNLTIFQSIFNADLVQKKLIDYSIKTPRFPLNSPITI